MFSNPNKKVEISTPYDPVHLTHVGFNSDTGEFTVSAASHGACAVPLTSVCTQGLPKEWQQLLQDSGVSKEEQAAHPQAVAEIVAFYQDATKGIGAAPGAEQDDVWKKFGQAPPPPSASSKYGGPGPIQFEQPVSRSAHTLTCDGR